MANFISRNKIRDILKERRDDLLSKENVVGVAIGKKISKGEVLQHDGYTLVVFVEQKKSIENLDPEDVVPQQIDGVITDVVSTGIFSKELGEPSGVNTGRMRPAPGGISVGHKNITAGTLGAVVYDAHVGYKLILSNNHVIADSNSAKIGDEILQPGPHDGGKVSTDTIAKLDRYIPIKFPGIESGCTIASAVAKVANTLSKSTGHETTLQAEIQEPENLVDAATALPLDQDDLDPSILNLGEITGTDEVDVGDEVTKAGRTTGTTTGTILYLDAAVRVNFGPKGVALFVDQIVTTDMSAGGDSGSVVCKQTDNGLRAVGLLFAGSPSHTIANKISNVKEQLDIKFTS